MTKLTPDDVKHVADLAYLRFTDQEITRLVPGLSSILQYIDVLNEIDTTDTKPTYQVTGIVNDCREDEVKNDLCGEGDLLQCSALPKQDDQIAIKSIM